MLTLPTEFARLQKAPKASRSLRTPSGQFCNVNFGCDHEAVRRRARAPGAGAVRSTAMQMVDFVAEGFGTPGNDSRAEPGLSPISVAAAASSSPTSPRRRALLAEPLGTRTAWRRP
jgi:hypothetical protein